MHVTLGRVVTAVAGETGPDSSSSNYRTGQLSAAFTPSARSGQVIKNKMYFVWY